MKSIGEDPKDEENLRFSAPKGLALATETIVVMVLAGVVLAALLMFFGGTFTPAKDEAKKTFNHARWCGDYVRYDSNCDDYYTDFWKKLPDAAAGETSVKVTIRTELNTVCKALGFGEAIPESSDPSAPASPDEMKSLRTCCESYCVK